MAVIDSHHHFWDRPDDYAWMSDLTPIRRPFGPDDLAPIVSRLEIDRTILVQARGSLEETANLLAVAAGTTFVGGVVGWVDLTAPDVADTLDRLRQLPGGDRLVGIRHQVQDEEDPDWLLRSAVERGIAAVGEAGLAYDLLVQPRELPAALETVGALPEVRFVIDHLAKPPIRDGEVQPWAELMEPFGELENAWCKVSGMVTQADWETWRPADLVPFVDEVLEVFGPRRLMFGSDWPVCLLAATYEQVYEAARLALGDLSEVEQAAVFGESAARVYRLGRGGQRPPD
ncbi:MAG: amidohydrolase family protein [Chloroflexota bacterium]